MRWASRLILSTSFFGVLLFIFSAAFPPFDDATEVDLTLHMTQHVMIVISGVLISYPLYGRRLLKGGAGRNVGWLGLVVSSLLILFWHYPLAWDAAVLNPFVHVLEHLSFLFIGGLCGSWILLLSDSAKIGALLAAFFGHMGYAVALISPWNVQVYALYPLANQMILGWALLLTGPILTVGVGYVVARNPTWLGGYSGGEGSVGPRETILNRVKVPKLLLPLLSSLIIIILTGYVGFTAYALGSSAGYSGGGTVVYIEETPFSWQYSPQNVTVVLGVNSTVTWVSHSISYDTVTGRGTANGPCGSGFASCPIPPGQKYTYMFAQPGVYYYYCQYHPWMVGKVTVLPSG